MTRPPERPNELPVDPGLGGGPGLRTLGAIGAGGALGGLARYTAVVLTPAVAGVFPWTTLTVNLSGSFALGVLVVVLLERFPSSRYLRPFLATGLLGAYTTFSTLAIETDLLVRQGRTAVAALYLFLSLAGGVAAAWAGMRLGRTAGSRGR
ncbi:MAG TPA: CrcB family protein [Actinomycetota bacterium]|nr:CrcB family protein [Actinomycetota bacterium]